MAKLPWAANVEDEVEEQEVEEQEVEVVNVPRETPASLIPAKPQERGIDRIPNLSTFLQVEIFAFAVGLNGYRFSTSPNPHAETVWSKKMNGIEAMQFLRAIKTKNKYNRLESREIPTE